MAISFREFPWYVQLLVFSLLAVLIFGAGEIIPGSPVQKDRAALEQLTQQRDNLQKEVTEMQVYERRYADFKRDVEGLQKQLDTLKTIVPEEKETDEFIRLLQAAASASNVSGIFTVTTFFTKSAEAVAPAQPAKAPGAQPGKQ